MKSIRRRLFLKHGALALAAMGIPPAFIARTLFARTRGAARGKTVVFVFQRGAADGLAMVAPYGERAYYRVRGSTAIPPPRSAAGSAALDLDGFFGLHPELGPLYPLFFYKEMAVVHACGSPHPTRSHFDAQEFMETATPGERSRVGWLNRLLTESTCRGGHACGRTLADGAAHDADHASGQAALAEEISPLRGVAIGGRLPRALQGPYPAVAIDDVERFGLADPGLEAAFQRLYRDDSGDVIATAAGESFAAVERLRRAEPARYRPRPGIEYPGSDFGRSLLQVAQLVKADVGLEVAFVDIDGWDTHLAQGGAHGQMALQLRELARGIRAFVDDLGSRMEDVVLVTMSEFGRTVAENGAGGTDHGHGNCMLVIGGGVGGGRVLGEWPGLERELLHEGRDLAITTDFRDVFAEIVTGHLGAASLERVFPGYGIDPARFRGVLA